MVAGARRPRRSSTASSAMSRLRFLASSSTVSRATLFVPSIHCPSCVAHLERAVEALIPRATSCSASLVNHSLSFSLCATNQELNAAIHDLCDELAKDGFPVQDAQVQDARGRTRAFNPPATLVKGKAAVHAAVSGFERLTPEAEARWKKHQESCAACRLLEHPPETSEAASRHQATDAATSSGAGACTVELSIGGMTCASCVGNVEKAVGALEGIRSFHVDLLSNSGRAVLDSPSVQGQLVESIEDAGYDAEVMTVEPLDEGSGDTGGKSFRATVSVDGMTCASCAQQVRASATAGLSDAKACDLTVDVSLMNNSLVATFVADDAGHAETLAKEVAEAVDDAGFETAVVKVEQLGPASDEKHKTKKDDDKRRTVRVRIEGMFCSHCVDKIKTYLQSKQPALSCPDADSLSLSQPVVTLSYLPAVSAEDDGITLRGILAGISALDAAFTASYVAPPSLMSRSSAIAAAEFRHYLLRFALAFVFAVPTLIIGVVSPAFLSSSNSLRRKLETPTWGAAMLGDLVLWALSTPCLFGVGSLFFIRAFKSLRSVWRPGRKWSDRLLRWGDMNVLVALGTGVAYFASLAFVLIDAASPPDQAASAVFFDATVFLVFFILMGRVLESWSKRKTGDAVAALGALRPATGLLVTDRDGQHTLSTDVYLLEVGDVVIIPAGASPPLDCEIIGQPEADGSSAPDCDSAPVDGQDPRKVTLALFDESAITGESRPVKKAAGDVVFAGTNNVGTGPARARITAPVGENLIDGILDAVRQASSRKASIEKLADRLTSYFVPVIVLISVLVLCLWTVLLYGGALSQDWVDRRIPNAHRPGARFLWALQFSVSCLVIACPCGIGLAAPTAQMAGIGVASKHGILINGGGEVLQAASSRDRPLAFVFDKTGTITQGTGGDVVDVLERERELDWAGVDLAEQGSTHPIGEALRRHCASRKASAQQDDKAAPKLLSTEELVGRGLVCSFDRFTLLIGNASLLREAGCDISADAELQQRCEEWQGMARSVVFIGRREGQGSDAPVTCAALVAIADPVRPEAAKAISSLRKRYGAEVWMVSGDAERTAQAVASEVGIEPQHVAAGVLPEGKQEWVRRIRDGGEEATPVGRQGRLVIAVGDGINDSPMLASADVGIAMGTGSSIAASAAGVVILNRTAPLLAVANMISISRATTTKIYTNFGWACIFNACMIPIAAGALEPVGFSFGPSWSGLAMALSSVSVVVSALTLRLWRPTDK